MNQDYYAVYRQERLISVEQAPNWVEASKQAARQEKDDTGENYPWTHYHALYITPKQWSRFGISIDQEDRTGGEEKASD